MSKEITVEDLADTQYREFALYDNERSIPNIIDGLKTSSRKVLYTCFKKNITDEMRVSQLTSYVMSETHYQHGDASLNNVIINMAQDFDTNNINLLKPIGQFGTRTSPKPSSPRYIKTHVNKDIRKYFKKDDDEILTYLDLEGDPVEPSFYVPILPFILINGTEGVGVGFASKILPRKVSELKEYILRKLHDKDTSDIKLYPCYERNFNGTIIPLEKNQYAITGKLKKINTTTIKIIDAPIGYSKHDIKEELNKLEEEGIIKDYDCTCVKNTYDVTVYAPRSTIELSEADLMLKFKLYSKVTENFTVWLDTGKLKKFDSPQDLVDYYINIRLQYYEKRKAYMISKLQKEVQQLLELFNFIKYYLNDPIGFTKKSEEECKTDMKANGFNNIDDLLKNPIKKLTKEEIIKLANEIKSIKIEIQQLEASTAKNLYINELKAL